MTAERMSIRISRATRTDLRGLKGPGETYDQLVRRLIDLARRQALFEEMDRTLDTEEFEPLR